jgi:hypothetical protein
VRDALDAAIDKSAPGFKQYLSNYAQASTPIDAMKFLQGLKLTDAQGNLTLAKVQGAIDRINAQRAQAGIKPGKAVADIQMNALENLRDDLLRKSNLTLGKTPGSNTVQNAVNQQRLGLAHHVGPGTATTLGSAGGLALGSLHSPEAGGIAATGGAMLGNLIGRHIPDFNALMRAQIQGHLENMLLDPSAYANAPAVQGAVGLGPAQLRHVAPIGVLAGQNRLVTGTQP